MLAASIPSELTKQAAKIRQSDEDKYMDMLLSEEPKRKFRDKYGAVGTIRNLLKSVD